jgi:hypothetical protein
MGVPFRVPPFCGTPGTGRPGQGRWPATKGMSSSPQAEPKRRENGCTTQQVETRCRPIPFSPSTHPILPEPMGRWAGPAAEEGCAQVRPRGTGAQATPQFECGRSTGVMIRWHPRSAIPAPRVFREPRPPLSSRVLLRPPAPGPVWSPEIRFLTGRRDRERTTIYLTPSPLWDPMREAGMRIWGCMGPSNPLATASDGYGTELCVAELVHHQQREEG